MVTKRGARFRASQLALVVVATMCNAGTPTTSFSVTQDIALKVTHRSCTVNPAERVVYSPDKRYFFVYSERGRLDINRVEDALRIYQTADVEHFLGEGQSMSRPPVPVWEINASSAHGPVMLGCRWLADSRGVAFLERSVNDDKALMLAELREHRVRRLTRPGQSVDEFFDVLDARHFIYRIARPDPMMRSASGAGGVNAASVSINNHYLSSLLLPDVVASFSKSDDWTSETASLWVATDGNPRELRRDGVPITVTNEPALNLALSPDGREVVTVLPVEKVPTDWEMRYPPPLPEQAHRVRAGSQDLDSYLGAHRYVRIDLASGIIEQLTSGPTGFDAGWLAANVAAWSHDGTRIALTAAYPGAIADGSQSPCVTVFDVKSGHSNCVLALRAPGQTGYFDPMAVEFVEGDSRRIRVTFYLANWSLGSQEFEEDESGNWSAIADPTRAHQMVAGTRIWIEEDLNHPPRLLATREGRTRLVWDPNPELNTGTLGQVSVYHWRDPKGNEWTGGLYAPALYRTGERYPLVIQTHGFSEEKFDPDGIFTTANAAQALASTGLFVLQVADMPICHSQGAEEAKCAAAGYDAAVDQLSAEGKIDRQRVGIEGFSWTCLYVTEALAFGATPYRAATITDGVMLSYWEYLVALDNGTVWTEDANKMIGASPFGEGLPKWLQNSPIFHLDRASAAVQVVALGKQSLLSMWEPYSRLRYLHEPVDGLLLNTSEHVLTNPRARLASQGGVVDWFRFWLKGEEDPIPEKRSQYLRWRALRAESVVKE